MTDGRVRKILKWNKIVSGIEVMNWIVNERVKIAHYWSIRDSTSTHIFHVNVSVPNFVLVRSTKPGVHILQTIWVGSRRVEEVFFRVGLHRRDSRYSKK